MFEKVVLISLSFLKETGVNHEGNLLVFLSSLATPKPELAILSIKDHGWVGLLRDSPDSCAMAMFGDNCLEFKHQNGSSCGTPGRSSLRTNLVLNKPPPFLRKEALLPSCDKYPDEDDEIWGSWWNPTDRCLGQSMWLGKQGNLSVIEKSTDGTLLVDWRASPVTLGFMNLMRKAEAPHREYLEVDRSPVEERVRPLPVFVLSELRSHTFYV